MNKLTYWINVSNGTADGTWNVKKSAQSPIEAVALALPCHKQITQVDPMRFETPNGLTICVQIATT